MSDARTTLEVILKSTGFVEGTTAIKNLGTEATNTNAKLKTTTSTVDQVSKSTTSLGSKLKNAGSQFAGTITSVAALGSTVVNLSRQYQDLSDTQIRVDKTQLKVSRTAEAVNAAQAKLNKLVSSGVKSGAAYQQALLDVQQAQEANTLAVTMNGEALEDQQRAYENFAMTLAPTILTAGSSITSMFKEMGGTKGLGGFAEKLKGLSGASFGGLGGLTAILGPLALAAAAATAAFIAYDNAMKKVAEAKSEQELAKNAKTLADELSHVKKEFDALKLKPGSNPVDFLASLGGGGIQNYLVDQAEKAKEAIIKEKTETEALTKARKDYNEALKDPALRSHVTDTAAAAKATLAHAEAEVKRLEAIEKTIPETEKLSTTLTAANRAMGEKGSLFDTMTKPFTGKSVFYTMATDVETLKAQFIALNEEADRSEFWKLMSGGNKSATTKFSPPPLFKQETLDFFVGSWEGGMKTLNTEWEGFSKASDNAATKIVADQKAAAIEYETAWQKAFGVQVSALDKIFAAYHKLHPGGEKDILNKKGKKIGTRTTAPGQLPVDLANKAFEEFEAGLAQKITSPASAKTYAKNWITTASAHMSGIAGQLISPITTYINEHRNDAPDAFLTGLKDTIANYDATKTFQELLQPGVQVGGTVGTTAGNVMAKNINTGLADVKVPPKTISALDTQLAKVKADMAKKPATINVTSKTTEAVKLAQLARNKISQMTATMRVKIQPVTTGPFGKLGLANWGIPQFAAGYLGTVKRPTMFMAGEGGRQEDVSIKPRGSAGGSGGGTTVVNVFVDGVQRPARYSMGARK